MEKIRGWAVRDISGYTAIYESKNKLYRGNETWYEMYPVDFDNLDYKAKSSFICSIPDTFFPELNFYSDPIEVEVTVNLVDKTNSEPSII